MMRPRAIANHLANDIADSFDTPPFCDLIVKAERDSRHLKCHQAVLAAACPLLRLSFQSLPDDESKAHLVFTGLTFEELRKLILFAYGAQPIVERLAEVRTFYLDWLVFLGVDPVRIVAMAEAADPRSDLSCTICRQTNGFKSKPDLVKHLK